VLAGHSVSGAAPFLKWAGGKGRLLPQLRPLLPARFNRYFEPFLGGGALFFALAPERAVLSDINPALVRTYEAVRDEIEGVLAVLRRLSTHNDADAYYHRRERYNTIALDDDEHAATFIYLNRTCFNGLHRVNKSGEFNVPFGRYKNPRIVDEPGLRAASAALAGASLLSAGFGHVLDVARAGDLVYFDPPYVPASATASFTAYAKDGFGLEEQCALRNIFLALDRRGCFVVLSNSDTPTVRELYEGFRFESVRASRAIAAKGSSRAAVAELVVRNFDSVPAAVSA
jgi:DNA adenine methylase